MCSLVARCYKVLFPFGEKETIKTMFQFSFAEDELSNLDFPPRSPGQVMYDMAYDLASERHEGAYRKLSGKEYFTHPRNVAELLQRCGCSGEVIAAGLLHDVVEDTETSLDEIRFYFNSRIAELVAGCSEPLLPGGGKVERSWDERKLHTMEYLKSISDAEVLMIAVADKLDNVLDTEEHGGPDCWDKFNSEPSAFGATSFEKQAWYYRTLAEIFQAKIPEFDLTSEYVAAVKRIFG